MSNHIQEIRMTGKYCILSFKDYAPTPHEINLTLALDNGIRWDKANKRLTLINRDVGTGGSSR
ncbi:pilus assembly protein PilW, partial [Pseudomonas syringae pv. tagetis]